MEFFSGIKRAYEKIETEFNKSLNIEGDDRAEGDEDILGPTEPVDGEVTRTSSSERDKVRPHIGERNLGVNRKWAGKVELKLGR